MTFFMVSITHSRVMPATLAGTVRFGEHEHAASSRPARHRRADLIYLDPQCDRRPDPGRVRAGGRIRIISDDGIAVAIGGGECSEVEMGPLAPGDGVPIALADRIFLVLHLVEPGAPTGVDRMA